MVEMPITMDENEKVADLMQRVSVLESKIEFIREKLEEMGLCLRLIREKLEKNYRPPWNVVVLITVLSSLCVGLITRMLSP